MAPLWDWTQRACHGGWKRAGMLVPLQRKDTVIFPFQREGLVIWSYGQRSSPDRSIVNLVVMTMMKRAKELNQMNSELVLKTQIH